MALSAEGFAFPALSVFDPRAPVDQRHAAGVRACFDIRVRQTGRVYLVFDDGAVTIEPPSSRQVDCHISADPTTLFLLFWSRTRQWPAALSGRLRVWAVARYPAAPDVAQPLGRIIAGDA